MADEIERPDWLVPGADVVVYTNGVGYSTNAHRTKIDKVAAKSFTLVGSKNRYRMATRSYSAPGSWSSTWYCVPLDSEEGRSQMAAMRARSLTNRAQGAVDEWQRSRTKANRLAAIKALQAIEVDEEPAR